jgi:hypothetical protein
MAPTIEEYRKALKELGDDTCFWCKAELDYENLEHYDHSNGVPIDGHEEKQWLYTVCPSCEYQWAWHKLLVGRYDEWKAKVGEA